MYFIYLLIESRKKINAKSYAELGIRALGPQAKYFIDLTVTCAMLGYVCARIFLIVDNLTEIFGVNKSVIFVVYFIFQSLLSFIRKI